MDRKLKKYLGSLMFFAAAASGASGLHAAENRSILADVRQNLNHFSGPEFNASTCLPALRTLTTQIQSINPGAYGMSNLQSEGSEALQLLWKTRLAMHRKLPELPKECALEMREAFRMIRAVEDYIGELLNIKTPVAANEIDFQTQPVPLIDHPSYYGVFDATESAGKPFQFRSGDVIITRGVSFLSAVIARIDDINSQFSHIVLVHVDDETGKVSTVESYVGSGVGIFDRDFALKNENARILVLRPKDATLGKQAADFMFALTRQRIDHGSPIPYDYDLNFDEHSRLSCAEVARYAYEAASGGTVILPQYASTVSLKDERFLDSIGLKRGSTFTPADMEVDSRFDLVADFRDYRLVRDSRYKDAVLSRILTWMNEGDYQLRTTPTSFIASHVVYPSRTTFLWPLVKAVTGAPDFSAELRHKTFMTIVQLNDLGSTLLTKLQELDQAHTARTGLPMTNIELEMALEELRAADLEQYRGSQGTESLFHDRFRPTGLNLRPQIQLNDNG